MTAGARASIPGIGKDSLNVTIQETGVKETVYSYGEYMRRFVQDVKAKRCPPYPVLTDSPQCLGR